MVYYQKTILFVSIIRFCLFCSLLAVQYHVYGTTTKSLPAGTSFIAPSKPVCDGIKLIL